MMHTELEWNGQGNGGERRREGKRMRRRETEREEIWSEWARENDVHFICSFSSSLRSPHQLQFFHSNSRLWQHHEHQSLIFIVRRRHLYMAGKWKVVIIRILTITPPLQCRTTRNNSNLTQVTIDHHHHRRSDLKSMSFVVCTLHIGLSWLIIDDLSLLQWWISKQIRWSLIENED